MEAWVSEALREQIANLPEHPGVYLMKDETGQVIYVGKAINLKNRVRSYFQGFSRHNPKTQAMVKKIHSFELLLVNNEVEALLLESNLIKAYRPKYNIQLRDDKNYPYLCLTMTEEFPRLILARKYRDNGDLFFGPFVNTGKMWATVKLIHEIFPLRSCKEKELTRRSRPCLNAHIGKCKAPCAGNISREQYMEMVEKVKLFLQGKIQTVVDNLQKQMETASEEMRFEEAAFYRDQLLAVKEIVKEQHISENNAHNRDVVSMALAEKYGVVQLFFVRSGKIVGREHFFLEQIEGETEQAVLANFLQQYYSLADYLPKEILISHPLEPELLTQLERVLSEKKGSKIKFVMPQKGDKRRLIELALDNAKLVLSQRQQKEEREENFAVKAMEELRQILDLPKTPLRIEGYDISHMQGSFTVGAMVVFTNGMPDKKEYRHYRMKTIDWIDDYASLREMVGRRMRRGQTEKEQRLAGEKIEKQTFARFPDMILIDGGKGQLSAVKSLLNEIGFSSMPIFSLAERLEEIYRPGQAEPIVLPRESYALQLLQQIRDESHRFGITRHRYLRGKNQTVSVLDAIPGIGEKRKEALLKHFGSAARIGKAEIEELAFVPGMNHKAAEIVYTFFRKQQAAEEAERIEPAMTNEEKLALAVKKQQQGKAAQTKADESRRGRKIETDLF